MVITRFSIRVWTIATSLILSVPQIYADLEVPVKRRLLMPDFVYAQNSGNGSKLHVSLAARLRDEIEKTERFSLLDQKLLSELRPKFKGDLASVEEWG